MSPYVFLTFADCVTPPARQQFELATDSDAFALSIAVAREHADYSHVLIMRRRRPIGVRSRSPKRPDGELTLFVRV